jgi:hypothetical protein
MPKNNADGLETLRKDRYVNIFCGTICGSCCFVQIAIVVNTVCESLGGYTCVATSLTRLRY